MLCKETNTCCYLRGGCVAPYGCGKHFIILTCVGGRCPGDSEYSTQTLTHGPQREVGGGNTQLEQPTRGPWGWESWEAEPGGRRWLSEAIWGVGLTVFWGGVGPTGVQATLSERNRERA